MVHMLSAARKAAALSAAFLIASSTTHALPQTTQCLSTHPLVGSVLTFRSFGNVAQLSGTMTIVNDCTADVRGFNVVGGQPPFVIVGTNPNTPLSILMFETNSLVILPGGLSQQLRLRPGFTWSTATVVLILADDISIGSAVLTPVASSTTTRTTTVRPSPTAVPIMNSPMPSPSPEVRVSTLAAPKLLSITTGSNDNYPFLPTFENVSYYVNGLESPVLNLTRGVEYQFIVIAGPTHPFYLTTSEEGNRRNNQSSGETVFLGNARTTGTPEAPLYLSFTPNSSHPDQFYYQCWNHRRMGYIINLVNGTGTSGNSSADPISNNITPPLIVSGATTAFTTSGALAIIMVILASLAML